MDDGGVGGAVSGTQWVLQGGGYRAVVVEVGGGLRNLCQGGREVVDGYGPQEIAPGGAGQVLAPWPNRIRDGRFSFAGRSYQLALSEPAQHNAIHGLVRWAPWRPVAVAPDTVTLEYVLPAQVGYPWTLRLATTWAVGPDGLRVRHTATNRSGQPCPFGLGVHPYLMLPGTEVADLTLTLGARNRLLLDARMLPIGAARVAGGEFDFTAGRRLAGTELDTAFGDLPPGGTTARLADQGTGAAVEVWADEAFRWWQVFTGHTLPRPRTRRSVALEPMTCPPDAFHSGRDLVTLAPGGTWSGAWGVRAFPPPGQ